MTVFEEPFLKPFIVTSIAAPDSATDDIYISVIESKQGMSPHSMFLDN